MHHRGDIIFKRLVMDTQPTQSIIDLLEETLPPCFPRKRVGTLTFGMINPRSLANKDSEKKGVSGAYRINREVWYLKKEFIAYVKTLLENCS